MHCSLVPFLTHLSIIPLRCQPSITPADLITGPRSASPLVPAANLEPDWLNNSQPAVGQKFWCRLFSCPPSQLSTWQFRGFSPTHSNIQTAVPGSRDRQRRESVIKFYGREYLDSWTMHFLAGRCLYQIWKISEGESFFVVFHPLGLNMRTKYKLHSFVWFSWAELENKLKLYLFSWESKVGVDITGVCGSIRRSPE